MTRLRQPFVRSLLMRVFLAFTTVSCGAAERAQNSSQSPSVGTPPVQIRIAQESDDCDPKLSEEDCAELRSDARWVRELMRQQTTLAANHARIEQGIDRTNEFLSRLRTSNRTAVALGNDLYAVPLRDGVLNPTPQSILALDRARSAPGLPGVAESGSTDARSFGQKFGACVKDNILMAARMGASNGLVIGWTLGFGFFAAKALTFGGALLMTGSGVAIGLIVGGVVVSGACAIQSVR
ncbi:MAG: hypothetical protein HY078_15310 [Elusimicrobia bacterium]|nr:hypothetical protein [Elusimicrobiota bacterium]